MTSEAPHRPGQEPGEVPPGAGGPTPYGDRSAQQDNGYPGAPDLGWAPPPPARQPGQPTPAWAAQDEQQPAPTWDQQGGQPPTTAAWGAAQVPQQAEAAGWATPGDSSQPTWGAQEQAGPAWAATSAPGPQAEQFPAWATPQEQPGPAWATEPAPGSGEHSQPAWAQAEEPNARGTAQVPAGQPNDAWATQHDPARSGGWTAASTPQQDDPARSGGWAAGSATPQYDDSARSGGWAAAQQDDPARSGGWAGGAAAPQHDDPARSGGWATQQQDSQPAWTQQGEQPAPAWTPGGAPVRGAAQVPAPTGQPNEARAGSDDPARSGGWAASTDGQPDDPASSGGWATSRPARQDDDPDRSGGWAAGRAAQAEQPQPASWGAQAEQSQPASWGGQAQDAQPASWGAPENQAATGWSGAAAVPQQREDRPTPDWATPQQREDRPTPDWATPQESAQAGTWGAAAVPAQGDDRSDGGAWAADQPAAARASASVPSPDGPPAWGANQDNAPKWTPERPVVPDAEPWSANEAWGRPGEAESAAQQSDDQQSNGWEPTRAEESPVYQPAPAPGISPANAVPLPPQEQRVPGASLAAAPPPAAFSPAAEVPAQGEAAAPGPRAYESEQSDAVPGWRATESSHEQSQPSAGPVIPAPRTSPESGAAGSVSASASVPLASRVTPPADQDLHPAGAPAPQPRVYGRPARPEPDDAPEQEGPQGQPEQGRRHDVPHPRFADHDRPPNANASAPPVPSAPPSSPAAPPPFPPGVPSFADPAAHSRPVNGVHPHRGERPVDPFGGPGRHGGPGDPFGPRGDQGDPFGGPGGQGFGGPAGGRATVNAGPGHGPGAMNEQAQGAYPPAFPPPPQQAPPGWPQHSMGGDPEQGRFDTFKPDAEPKTEAPTKVRNGRVLAAVLIAAVLILAIPLGLLKLLGKIGGDDQPAPFNPAVGSCIKQSGPTALPANCADPGAFTVVSKVESKDKCADPTQPTVELKGVEGNRWLCLKAVGK